MDSLVDIFVARAANDGARTAYTFLEEGAIRETLTWSELDAAARGVAAALVAHGVESGNRVLISYPAGLGYVLAIVGTLYAGATAVPMPYGTPRRLASRLERVAADSEAGCVLAPRAMRGAFVGNTQSPLAGLAWLAVEDAQAMDAGTQPPRFPSSDAPAFLQYTSGSVGDPKACVITHRNVLSNEEAIRRAFRHDSRSIVVGWLPLYHDMGLFGNLLQPAFVGCSCVLFSSVEFFEKPLRWLQAITQFRACTSGAPDFAFDLCVRRVTAAEQAGLDLRTWRVAFNGAEPVRADTLRRFSSAFASCGFREEAFYPCYGLAEATLFVAGGEAENAPRVLAVDAQALQIDQIREPRCAADRRELVSCGAASAGGHVAIVDPRGQEPLPEGRIGEIWVSGPNVAAGYFAKEEATRATFGVELRGERHTRYLRTGDLGCLLDGELFVTGRLKDLIILRGRNYYPQDIERAAEQAHSAIRVGGCAAFLAPVAEQEQLVLVCEVEHRRRLDAAAAADAVRRAIAARLDVGVNTIVFVRPGQVPKTTSGKTRRMECRRLFAEGSLARIESGSRRRSGGPAASASRTRDELSSALAQLLAQLLGRPPEGLPTDCSLAALGLDSLLTARLAEQLERRGMAVPLAVLHEAESLEELVGHCAAARRTDGHSSVSGQCSAPQPLTGGQRSLWLHAQLFPQSSAYNLLWAVRLYGTLNVAALRNAFVALQTKHEALRTRVILRDGEPWQRWDAAPVELIEESAHDCSYEQLLHRLRERAARPFELQTMAPIEAVLYSQSDGTRVLLLRAHHIAVDLGGAAILLRDLTSLCERLPDSSSECGVPFGEYVRREHQYLMSAAANVDLAFWQSQIERVAAARAPLPRDRSTGKARGRTGSTLRLSVSGATERALRRLGQEAGCTAFEVHLALFAIWLAHWSGRSDVVVGVPFAVKEGASFAELVGYCVNVLPVPISVDAGATLRGLLQHVRAVIAGVRRHRRMPLEVVAERAGVPHEPGRPAFFDVAFVWRTLGGGIENSWHTAGAKPTLAGAAGEILEIMDEEPQFDVALMMTETATGLSTRLVFDAEIFERAAARRAAQRLAALLRAAADDPDAAISKLAVLGEAERRMLVDEFAGPTRSYAPELTLQSLLAGPVERTPHALALLGASGGGVAGLEPQESWTYVQLWAAVSHLAARLQRSGVGPGQVVGIVIERSAAMVVAILATIQAGAGYLPLDPEDPDTRLRQLLAHSDCRIVLSVAPHARRLACTNLEVIDVSLADPACEPRGPVRKCRAEDLAYLIYTSGSTGAPKGVMVEHRSIVNRLLWMTEVLALTANDVFIQKTPATFDVSVWELLLPLVLGAPLVLLPPGAERDPAAVTHYCERFGVTIAHFVPSMLLAFLRHRPLGTELPRWRCCVCSGETLDANLRDRFYEAFGTVALFNFYGPTEAAVDVTWHRVGRQEQEIPLGRAAANVSLRILDAANNPVPIGTPGELCISGVQVARGYVSQPELTALVFGTDPIDGRSPLYRTGDVARFRGDGAVVFLGRKDTQVKLRGRRVELGEIEAALCEYPGVGGAVVALHPESSETPQLVAFVLAASLPPLQALLAFLKQRLPRQLIPAAFAALAAWPLSRNGKLDRSLLPFSKLQRAQSEYRQPRGATERALSVVWAAELGVADVGIDDNFFDLGGDSIRALRIVAAAARSGLNLSVAEVFRYPTIAALAAGMRSEPEGAATPRLQPFALISDEWRARLPADVEDAYPLSSVQQSLVFLSETSPVYEVYVTSLHLRGRFEADCLRTCVQRALQRHPFLRASFDLVGFAEAIQRIHRDVRVPVEIVDWTGLADDAFERNLAVWLTAERKRGFDHRLAPMLRVTVHRRSDRDFQFTLSDVSLDGWCVASLITEIFEDYAAQLECREASLSPPATTYATFISLERESSADEAARRFWLERTSHLEPSVLRRPQRPPGELRCLQERETLCLDSELSAGLESLARVLSVPLKSLLLAAHARVLSSLTGHWVVTGLEVHGRPETQDGDRVIGVFNNTVPCCIEVRGGTWIELIHSCWRAEQDLMPHRRYPYQQLCRQLRGSPLEVVFVYTDFHVYRRIARTRFLEVVSAWASDQTFFPLTAHFNRNILSGKLDLLLDFDPTCWPRDAIQALRESYRQALIRMVAAPFARYSWQAPATPIPPAQPVTQRLRPTTTVPAILNEQVRTHADRIALIYGEERISFRELWRRAGALALRLQEAGLKAERIAGVCMQRSPALVVALLAVWRTGAAFVPLNPADPADRRNRILRESAAVIVLTDREDLGPLPCPVRIVDTVDSRNRDACTALPAVHPGNAAYVMYTSGSTGAPKGVVIQHDSLAHYVAWAVAHYAMGEGGEVPVHTATSFDLTVTSQIAPLVAGDTVHLIEESAEGAETLARRLSRGPRPDLVKLTPSHLEYLSRYAAAHGAIQSPAKVVVGGEALRAEQLELWRGQGTRVFNEYGPTEATVGCCVYELQAEHLSQGPVPIGRPIADTHIYVLDHWQERLTPGLVGELWIAGDGLARAYFRDAAVTASRFRPDPFATQPGRRMYRSGDLGRVLPDGELEYLGRVDRQLKIRGFRVEPAEIEAALVSHPQIAAAVVCAHATAGGGTKLAGYVTTRGQTPPEPEELRRYLAKKLPPQLLPATLSVLDELPLTRNGKIDHRRLAECAMQSAERRFHALVEHLEHASTVEVASMSADLPATERGSRWTS